MLRNIFISIFISVILICNTTAQNELPDTRDIHDGFVVNRTLSGLPLHWADGEMEYHISESVPNRFRDPVKAGFDSWHLHDNLKELIRSDFMGLTPSTQWAGPADGINNVVYIDRNWTSTTGASEDIIALTRVRYNALTGRITDTDIALNADHHDFHHDSHHRRHDVHNIIAHEVGHVWGLSDLFPPDHPGHDDKMGDDEANQLRTMYAVFEHGETVKRTLSKRDVDGIKHIYDELPVLNVDIVLVYDGSDNYAVTHNALTQSKNSGLELVDKLRVGDRIGVVQFPDTVVNELTEIDEDNRDQVQDAIMEISPQGNVTVGSGLFKALDLLTNANSGSNLPFIILFSSGEEEGPEWAFDYIDAIGNNSTVPVYTIGFEGSPGQTTLNMVSEATGGAFFEVPDSTHIPDAVGEIWTQITNQLTLFVDGDIVSFENEEFEVLVDEDLEIFEPGIRIQGRTSKLNLCVVDPDGLEICFDDPDADESDEIICRDETGTIIDCPAGIRGKLRTTYEFFQITNPKQGLWKLLIENVGMDDKQFFGYANATARDFTMTAELDERRYIIGDPIEISVNLMSGGHPTQFGHSQFGDPITGADVVVRVTLPDGTSLSDISLQDANDGNYSAAFTQTDEPGPYHFRIVATGSNGEFTRVRRLSTYVATSEVEFAIQAAFTIFDHIVHFIETMDAGSFRPAGEGRRGSLLNKFDVVHGHMQAEEYEQAIQKLTEDILPKVDGDWVVGEDSAHLTNQVERLIRVLSEIVGMQSAMANISEGKLIEQGNTPQRFDILQNYPNPFNPVTTIRYQLPEDVHVTLTVYNMLGQRVRTLVDDMQTAGYYSVQWDGTNRSGMTLSSGMYFYRIQAGRYNVVRTMLFMK